MKTGNVPETKWEDTCFAVPEAVPEDSKASGKSIAEKLTDEANLPIPAGIGSAAKGHAVGVSLIDHMVETEAHTDGKPYEIIVPF